MAVQILSMLVILAFGIPATISDIRTKQVSNLLSIGFTAASALVVVIAWLFFGSEPVAPLIAGAVALIIYILLYLAGRGSLGEADVKLAPGFGFLLGLISTTAVMNWLLITFLMAGAFALIALVFRRANLKDSFAFAPFMFLAAIMVSAVY